MSQPARILFIGAHPDDCEVAGGIALKCIKGGHTVKFLTVTNGCSGHHEDMGAAISARRWQEARRVSELFGVEYEMLDNNDGSLTAGLAERWSVLRAIREWAPEVIFTHRPGDYHPDHRNTSVLVQDCSYLVQVPNVCAMTPPLRYQPAIYYFPDFFEFPRAFRPDLVFDISDVFEQKMRMYHQYTSQFYEWLPWVDNALDTVPASDEERFAWLMASDRAGRFERFADNWREALVAKYGERGKTARWAEALEQCEYGGRLSSERQAEIFAF